VLAWEYSATELASIVLAMDFDLSFLTMKSRRKIVQTSNGILGHT
jgi:hypothetical protein